MSSLVILFVLITTLAQAQTTNTVQFAGTPDPLSAITAPTGGLVLQGSSISPVTQQPVRHLWVADGTAGICRVDPDLDSPGPYAINNATCPFNTAAKGSILGGGMAFDSTRNLIYFVDNQRASQGVFSIGYLAGADSGNGLLDLTTLANLAGAPAGGTFAGGQTGCGLPGTQLFPNAAALDPQGNLWVGFARSPIILRFNNPSAANGAGFGTCAQFVQQVATLPNNRVGSGLAWIGHDLYGADPETPFVIRGADTTCLKGVNPACSTANGSIVVAPSLTTVVAPTSVTSDQIYPATNGNNLYFGMAANMAWVGNVAGGATGQSLTLTYIDPAQAAVANVGAVVLDANDPANLVLYSGDDPSALATAGAGRLFETTQTSAAPAAPGAPLNVLASIANGQATVSSSPAQVAQPVTSYTVHNNFASNETPLPDVTINPAPGSAFPATSVTIPGTVSNVSYQFQVLASNAQGSSPFSAPSNLAPVIPIPGAPTGAQAVAGDTQASVSWNAPLSNGGLPIASYTVTALAGGVSTGITSTVPATTIASQRTVISGLTNGTAYTFTVHATNAAASSQESTPSNAVNPSISNVPTMTILVSGPISVNPVPALVTYQVSVTNTSLFPITNVVVNNVLSTTDGAFIIAAEPDQATCTAGGVGVTTVACALGTIPPGGVKDIDVVVQMQRAQITMTSTVTASDSAGTSLTFKREHRTTTPPGTPPPGAPVISIPISAGAAPTSLNPGQQGAMTWTVQNNSGITANNVLLVITIDTRLTIAGVTTSPSTGPNPVSCDPPIPGLINTNLVICSIASLGGPKASNPVTTMKATVNVIAPNQVGLQLIPSGTVDFDGIDSSNPTATVVIRVH